VLSLRLLSSNGKVINMMKFCVTSVLQTIFLTVLVYSLVNVGLAQVRSSSNYQIESDSLNAGGGYSSSTNFQQESTIGEVSTGRSTSTSYSLRAGYQQMQEVFLSLAGGVNVILSPDLPGITGGESNGTTTFTVITDSPSGYELTIESEGDPAMQRVGGGSIDNYPGSLITPDYAFTAGSGEAYFGYTAQGVDIKNIFLDNGAACAVGSNDTPGTCWVRMQTTPDQVSVSTGANHPDGATTTINYRVGIGANAGVIAGEYYATTTVTALPL
jgi:hypothetical protein